MKICVLDNKSRMLHRQSSSTHSRDIIRKTTKHNIKKREKIRTDASYIASELVRGRYIAKYVYSM